jgi:3-methyladenine DNA glycosylase AlkD
MVSSDTPLSRTVLDRLMLAYGAAADPADAGPMRAYMRDAFPFLGIKTPRRRQLAKQIVRGLPAPDQQDLRAVALACWAQPAREYQYFAVDWLVKHANRPEPGFLGTIETLVTTRSWWDTVDPLATRVVGPIVARQTASLAREASPGGPGKPPTAVSTMDDWAADDNLWLARTALLHQFHYKEKTDTGRLFGYCAALAGHPDFFIRKAIGWALRQYARTDPGAVRTFVAATPTLSGLSVREAMKHLAGPPAAG